MLSTQESVFKAIKYLIKKNKKKHIPSFLFQTNKVTFKIRKQIKLYIQQEFFYKKAKSIKDLLFILACHDGC